VTKQLRASSPHNPLPDPTNPPSLAVNSGASFGAASPQNLLPDPTNPPDLRDPPDL